MKFALLLTLAPKAFASMDEFKFEMQASSAAIMENMEQARIPSAVSKELSFTEKALNSIRGLYTTTLPFEDDANAAYVELLYGTPAAVCSTGMVDATVNCYDQVGPSPFPGITVGPCASCYGTGGTGTNDMFSCYTCNTGYTLVTFNNVNASCNGACVPDSQDVTSLAIYGFAPIATSACFVFGGCYPITCNAAGTDGSCPSTATETATAASCFSGSDTVTLESGATKPLSEVRVGDKILSADSKGELSFSGVVALPHGSNDDAAVFFDVTTAGSKHVKATEMHLLMTCSGALAYAGSLKQGDCLRTADGDEAVQSVKSVHGKGLYTVVTQNEFPVVSGIVASPFAVSHGVGNAYYSIHRTLFKFAPALMKSSAVASANALVGTAVMFAAGVFSGSN